MFELPARRPLTRRGRRVMSFAVAILDLVLAVLGVVVLYLHPNVAPGLKWLAIATSAGIGLHSILMFSAGMRPDSALASILWTARRRSRNATELDRPDGGLWMDTDHRTELRIDP